MTFRMDVRWRRTTIEQLGLATGATVTTVVSSATGSVIEMVLSPGAVDLSSSPPVKSSTPPTTAAMAAMPPTTMRPVFFGGSGGWLTGA